MGRKDCPSGFFSGRKGIGMTVKFKAQEKNPAEALNLRLLDLNDTVSGRQIYFYQADYRLKPICLR
jgi:hypothetical protein